MASPSTRHFAQFLSLTTPSPPSLSIPPVVREHEDPYRLSMSVTMTDGRVYRWGPEDFSAENVPTGLTFGSTIPGGYKDLSCTLLRKLNVAYPDEALFANVRVYGPGNETAWDGRLSQLPRQEADQFSVQPSAVGWIAHLDDDSSFREIYVDRDLTGWQQASVQRRLNAVATYSITDASVTPDDTTGQPALTMGVTGPWDGGPGLPMVEAYYGVGIPISYIYYAWKHGADISAGDPNWHWLVYLSTDDVQTATDTSGELRAAGPSTGFVGRTALEKRFGITQLYYGGANATANVTNNLYWTCLAVYGEHGLTKQGVADATNAQGFYGSDVIGDVVRRAAPLLTFTVGPGGSISPTTFVIPHLVFADPTKASDAVSLVNGYHLYEWGVFDNREFFWRQPDPGRLTWVCRRSDGAQISLEGDDANNIFNGVFVTYTDPVGKKKTAGPPGSRADTEDATLVDTDPLNPVNYAGLPRRWGLLDVSQTTTPAGAVQLGQVWLNEHNQPQRRGQVSLTGLVEHPTRGKRPVWAVKAGDHVMIADRPGDPPRRVIEARYNHDSRQMQLSLDNTALRLDAILERIGVSLVGVL